VLLTLYYITLYIVIVYISLQSIIAIYRTFKKSSKIDENVPPNVLMSEWSIGPALPRFLQFYKKRRCRNDPTLGVRDQPHENPVTVEVNLGSTFVSELPDSHIF
jgi:hypothetical protein